MDVLERCFLHFAFPAYSGRNNHSGDVEHLPSFGTCKDYKCLPVLQQASGLKAEFAEPLSVQGIQIGMTPG